MALLQREWKTQQCQVKNLGVTVFRFSVFIQILTVPSALTTGKYISFRPDSNSAFCSDNRLTVRWLQKAPG